ncbi:MAG: cupin domain-containing protein, partial [Candidatus Geothermarchaeales archaeon]
MELKRMIIRNVDEIEGFDVSEAYGVKTKGVSIRWISEKRLGGPEYLHNFALRYFAFEPRSVLPIHKHPWEQEIIITKGRIVATSGGEERELGPRDVAYIPANEEHGFEAGDEGCEFYCIIGCVGEGENCIG